MESILIYVLFAVGIVLIVKGGDWFVDGAVWAAEITRIPKFIIGATIISVATTLPEIFVSTIAAVEGHGILVSQVGDYIAASQDKVGMAIGNGIGSVICNTAMILAISIIFMPIAVDKRSFAPKGTLLIAAVCALFLLSRSGNFSIAGAAVLLLSAGLAAMLLCLWLAPRRWNPLPAPALPPWEAEPELAEAQRPNIHRAPAHCVQDALLLLGGGEAGEYLDLHREAAEAVHGGGIVLLGQRRGGYQDGGLLAVQDALHHRPQGHLRLAEAHIAAQQPVHGHGFLHIGLDLPDGL